MTVTKEHLLAFRNHLRIEEKSPATQEKYLRDTAMFATYAGEQEITKELVLGWKQYLIEKNYAVRSINSMLASVNSFLDFFELGFCKVKNLRIQRQTYCAEEKELSKAEYFRLLTAAKGDEQLSLVLQTICATGIRVSEVQHFTVEAVKQGMVIVHCKNKTRNILVPSKLKKQLLNYAKKEGKSSGVIFTGKTGKPLNRSYIWAAMKKLCNAANVIPSKVFPHNLRKLFARAFYAMEKDIAKLADILGHSSINTTRIYIMTTGREHLQKLEQLKLII